MDISISNAVLNFLGNIRKEVERGVDSVGPRKAQQRLPVTATLSEFLSRFMTQAQHVADFPMPPRKTGMCYNFRSTRAPGSGRVAAINLRLVDSSRVRFPLVFLTVEIGYLLRSVNDNGALLLFGGGKRRRRGFLSRLVIHAPVPVSADTSALFMENRLARPRLAPRWRAIPSTRNSLERSRATEHLNITDLSDDHPFSS